MTALIALRDHEQVGTAKDGKVRWIGIRRLGGVYFPVRVDQEQIASALVHLNCVADVRGVGRIVTHKVLDALSNRLGVAYRKTW